MRSILILPLLICLSLTATCQEKKSIYIGLDVFKNLPPLFYKGGDITGTGALIIEPNVRIQLKGKLYFNGQLGYSRVTNEHIFNNLTDYVNQGYYVKSGLIYAFSNEDEEGHSRLGFSVGASLTASWFREDGTAELKGPVFGDFRQSYSKILSTIGLEIPLNIPVRLAQRWKLNFQFRGNVILTRHPILPFPVYYTPGVGINGRPNNEVSISNEVLTGGFTVQLFYQLR
jgi:hypothetical protein